jgi:hypothetical protein
MNKFILAILLAAALFVLSCSGKDMITKDEQSPTKPILIKHLGDTGDIPDSVFYEPDNAYVHLTDLTNGIDAVPDVDGIRLTWEHFLDLDLATVKIWRFDDYSDARVISEISASNESYTDDTNGTLDSDSLYILYSYFIEVVDRAGNSTRSDTVSYKLLEKQIPVSPTNGTVLSNMFGLHFVFNTSNEYSSFRVLLFDVDHNLRWYQNIITAPTEHQITYDIPYTGYPYTNESFSWRVDAFETDYISNIIAGSESNEFAFSVQ